MDICGPYVYRLCLKLERGFLLIELEFPSSSFLLLLLLSNLCGPCYRKFSPIRILCFPLRSGCCCSTVTSFLKKDLIRWDLPNCLSEKVGNFLLRFA